MRFAADRRVHHAVAAEPLVASGATWVDGSAAPHRWRCRGNLSGSPVPGRSRREGCAPGARCAAPAPSAGGCQGRHLLVAPLHVADMGIAGVEHRLAVPQTVFVLAVVGDARWPRASPAPSARRPPPSGCRWRMPAKILMAHTPRAISSGPRSGMFCLRSANIQTHVAPGRPFGVGLLAGQAFGIDDRRGGIGHVEDGGDATQHGRPGSGGDGFQPPGRRGRAGAHGGRSARARREPHSVDGFARLGPWPTPRAAMRPAARRAGLFDAPGQHAGAAADDQIVVSSVMVPLPA